MSGRRMPQLAALACALAVGAGCRRATGSGVDRAAPVVDGDYVTIPPGSPGLAGVASAMAVADAPDSVSIPGRLVWNDDATVRVFAPYGGRVTAVRADAGQRVTAGDTLAVIASSDFGQAEADARRAATDLGLASRTADRTRDLFAHGVVARKDLESAEADLARARTEYERTRARLVLLGADTTGVHQAYALRAPLGGVVVERVITPGQEVRSDQMLAGVPQLAAPLFTISDPRRLWLLLEIPERDLGAVRPGSLVRFQADAAPGAAQARITWVAPEVDSATRTVRARADVANPEGRFRAEMLVSARVAPSGVGTVTVPAEAVVYRDGAHVVFVQEAGGRIRRTRVEVGAERGGRVALLRGVTPGQRVVTTGALLLEALFPAGGPS